MHHLPSLSTLSTINSQPSTPLRKSHLHRRLPPPRERRHPVGHPPSRRSRTSRRRASRRLVPKPRQTRPRHHLAAPRDLREVLPVGPPAPCSSGCRPLHPMDHITPRPPASRIDPSAFPLPIRWGEGQGE